MALEPRLLLRSEPSPADNIYFRLPLASDTSVHYYFDRNPAAGAALAWNGSTTQTYDGHRGTDFSGGPRGRPVYAIAPGILIAKDDGHPDFGGPPNGNYVRINHGNTRAGLPVNSVYLHFNAGSVTTKPLNSVIQAGEQVGGIGTSGNSTGLHLHLETQVNRVAFDPYRAIGSSEASWWTDQGSGSPSTTPQPDKLSVGQTAEVYDLPGSTLQVRSTPAGSSIGSQPNGATGTVLEGPVFGAFNNDFNNSLWVWYRVAWANGMTGWSVQNWLRPYVDTTGPTVTGGRFVTGQGLNFRLDFSEPLMPISVAPSDLKITHLPSNQPVSATGITLSNNNATVTWRLPSTLPEGPLRFRINAGAVLDPSSNGLSEPFEMNFTFRRGDANGDGLIDFDDYAAIDQGFAAGFNGYANGDFNQDGVIDFDDYALIDFNFLNLP
jgi:hypothetical protein